VRTRRQRLGQHFLRDARVARGIVEALPAEPARVLEIGPGEGALTRHLLERFPLVRAVEIDGALARALPRRLGNPPGLEVVNADAVAAELAALVPDGPWLVAGNLPYSVASPLVRRLLPRHDLFTTLVVMVQLEVAHRIAARAGDAERGLLSVEAEALARAELLFTVAPRCFEPPPRVQSAVLRLALHPPGVDEATLTGALRLAGEGFCHRRKTLGNALATLDGAGELRGVLRSLGMEAVRPQELAFDDWVRLEGALAAARKGSP
jgi:16S rRNA (adenine1518-N6/adenine1519-N6)-dimethyltransferase